jgi:hypothetical protein
MYSCVSRVALFFVVIFHSLRRVFLNRLFFSFQVELRRKMHELSRGGGGGGVGGGGGDASFARDMGIVTTKLHKLERRITDAVFDSAEVVCATCIGAGAAILQNRTFALVLVDECTQATEPACLIPLVKATQQAILVRSAATPYVSPIRAAPERVHKSYNHYAMQHHRWAISASCRRQLHLRA